MSPFMTLDNILLEEKDCHGLENQFSKKVNLHEQKKAHPRRKAGDGRAYS